MVGLGWFGEFLGEKGVWVRNEKRNLSRVRDYGCGIKILLLCFSDIDIKILQERIEVIEHLCAFFSFSFFFSFWGCLA